eukprot:3185517-Prymnesium_polylepis.1
MKLSQALPRAQAREWVRARSGARPARHRDVPRRRPRRASRATSPRHDGPSRRRGAAAAIRPASLRSSRRRARHLPSVSAAGELMGIDG